MTLGVSDVERAASFYDALGWQRSSFSIPGEICWFVTADSVLGLFGYEALAEDAALPVPAERPRYNGVTLAINADSADDVYEIVRMAEAAGATVIKPPTLAEWGGLSGYFTDLDGYIWEVAHNPNFPIGPDGSLQLPT